jgi:protoporphyrin/coproporphyrin ferrochelatase
MGSPHSDNRLSRDEPALDADEYDAILVVGFGGPERLEDVLPFLENVTGGRNIPRARLLEVAEHYSHFGGVSPINAQVRALIAALGPELDQHGISLPIYWGNRNWHPLLADTLSEMTAAGIKRALAVVLAAFSSYSSCRQYREDIERARVAVGPGAPRVDKLRVFYNHPEFIAANADRVRAALDSIAADRRNSVRLAFTAHSIPVSMARNCDYEPQLDETCRLVAREVGIAAERWALVYQSRSGRPGDPWLEPDILDHLKDLRSRGVQDVVIHPIGFLSDHMEVMYDLDEEARHLCGAVGLAMVRSQTVGTHPRFVSMLRELIAERIERPRGLSSRAVGSLGPGHDVCPENCCLPSARPAKSTLPDRARWPSRLPGPRHEP